MAKSTSILKSEKALAGLAESLGLEYVEHELKKESGELYLRLIIDKEGGLSLEDCEKFHRQCIPLVENIEYDYLECSSPGIDRPLKTERDFQKNMGKQVEVRLFRQRDGQKAFFGTLQNYEKGSLGATFEISTQGGPQAFTLKETALVRPVIDYQAELSKGE